MKTLPNFEPRALPVTRASCSDDTPPVGDVQVTRKRSHFRF